MTTYYIDGEFGSDSNSGSDRNQPRKTAPDFADGDTWLFARGSTIDCSPVNGKPHLIKTPDYPEQAWTLTIDAYDRPLRNSDPMPIWFVYPDIQHGASFRSVNLSLSNNAFHGGFGSALRIMTKNQVVDAMRIEGCEFLTRKGKGLLADGNIIGAEIVGNIAARDLSVPSSEAPSGDHYHFTNGFRNGWIEGNQAKDSGHTSFSIWASATDDPCYGNVLIGNIATGHNSDHCRLISMSGLGSKCFGNVAIDNVGIGMATAYDKMSGIGNSYINHQTDLGMKATAKSDVESVGPVFNGGECPILHCIARHGESVVSPVFSDITGVSQIIIEELNDGKVINPTFNNIQCTPDCMITVRGTAYTIDEANQLPGFNLV